MTTTVINVRLEKIKVYNMTGHSGNPVANQFVIEAEFGEYFQSYETLIGYRRYKDGQIFLDDESWDYSSTTGKYRNLWLGENKTATEKKIKSGEYKLTRLNDGR